MEAGGESEAEQVEALAARLKSFYGLQGAEKDDEEVKVCQRLAQAEDARRRSDLDWWWWGSRAWPSSTSERRQS